VHHYAKAAANPSVSTICEVGYNWGATALIWLHSNRNAKVYCFDLPERLYTNATVDGLNGRYGGRLELIRGDSRTTIPDFAQSRGPRGLSCDLVLVDGDHSFAGELANVRNFRQLASCSGCPYIMDDCNCLKPSLATTRAWSAAVGMGFVVETLGHVTTGVRRRSQDFFDENERHSYCIGELKCQ